MIEQSPLVTAPFSPSTPHLHTTYRTLTIIPAGVLFYIFSKRLVINARDEYIIIFGVRGRYRIVAVGAVNGLFLFAIIIIIIIILCAVRVYVVDRVWTGDHPKCRDRNSSTWKRYQTRHE